MQIHHVSETSSAPYLVLRLWAMCEEAETDHPLCIQQNIFVEDWSWASPLFALSLLLQLNLLLVSLRSLQQSQLLPHTMVRSLLSVRSAISLGEDPAMSVLSVNIPVFFPGKSREALKRSSGRTCIFLQGVAHGALLCILVMYCY